MGTVDFIFAMGHNCIIWPIRTYYNQPRKSIERLLEVIYSRQGRRIIQRGIKMKTMKMDGVVANDEDIRNILDSFFYSNEPDVVKTANAKRVSDNAFDIIIRYTGELILPF